MELRNVKTFIKIAENREFFQGCHRAWLCTVYGYHADPDAGTGTWRVAV